MALDDLVGTNIHNQQYIPPTGNQGAFTQNNPNMLPPLDGRRAPFPVGGGGGLASIIQPGLLTSPGPGFGYNNRPMPLPVRPPGFGNFIGIQPPTLGIAQPDYSSQFEKFGETLGGFGEQLTGFGDQMTGYQDALGSFNEQMGGLGKQFETVNNKLDSVEKGIGSLGNQIASFENMQKAQPQEVRPQQPAYNPFGSPFGFGLASLFGRRY